VVVKVQERAMSWAASNNGLERTRRVGVPASRAVVGVSPRRSTQCSTGVGRPTFLTGKASNSCFSSTEIVVAASEVERGGYGEIFGSTTGSPVGGTGSPWSGVEGARRTIRSVVHNHRPSNKALHLTKVATNGLTPFAGERRCWTDHQGLQH